MKSNKNFNNKVLISILLIILFVLLIYFLINFKYKLLEGNNELNDFNNQATESEEGVGAGYGLGEGKEDNVEIAIDNTSKHLYDEQGNPDLIDDSTLTNEYMDAIKSPKELQEEMTDNNDVLNTMSYLRRGLNYAKIFISANDSTDDKYSVIKDGETLGKEQIVETIKNCTHCYNYDEENKTWQWQPCSEPAYKIVNNIPQSKNGILPGILENVHRVMPSPAIDLIVPHFRVKKTSDLLKIRNNDIRCVDYSNNWVMIDGMYDIPYKYDSTTYETGSTEDIKGIKDEFEKQEKFSNINDNDIDNYINTQYDINTQDDIIINLYYFSLVCFFIYIITKLMIKQ
tara:strand:- start:45 stop:1070 length:1026 start_codon:yes stop_codon:yes gene_type:complete